MTEKYKWPEDEQFKKFARLLADKVTVFLANGGKIAPAGRGCGAEYNCPIGVFRERSFPCHVESDGERDFMRAFDEGTEHAIYKDESYHRLGLEYRERFGY